MPIVLAENKEHLIIKRDGRVEPYNPDKLRRVLIWADNGRDRFTDEILSSIDIKINNKMRIEALYDVTINTVANMITKLRPAFDNIAKNLYLLKIYKETWNIKDITQYPDYTELLRTAFRYKSYDKETFQKFTKEELDTIYSFIKPEYDRNFTYKGLVMFFEKYCMNYAKTKTLELPQHVYIRNAIEAFCDEKDSKEKLDLIYRRYNDVAISHKLFEKYDTKEPLTIVATPNISNSCKPKNQLASCVLEEMADNTWSISNTTMNSAFYSKNGGGLAVDMTKVRCSGSLVGTSGSSNGPVPYIRMIQATIQGFNQLNSRRGAAVITFPWWNYDSYDLFKLKDDGGNDDKRARQLQYCMKTNDLYYNRIKKNKDITLIDAKDATDVIYDYGSSFNKKYTELESKVPVKRKKTSAREHWFKFLQARNNTGNYYIFDQDNVNKQNMNPTRYINSSNLCCEITLPSRAATKVNEELITKEDGNTYLKTVSKDGEIAICNLASINLAVYDTLSDNDKYTSIYTLLRGMDNNITRQFYPSKEGKYSNINYRPIGIGIVNETGWLANKNIKTSDKEAEAEIFRIMEDLSFNIYSASNQLAMERGKYKGFEDSRWAKGQTPYDISIGKKFFPEFKLTKDWSSLKRLIRRHGLRFSYHMAIAPTATSGKCPNLTEGIDPVLDSFYVEQGTLILPTLAYNFSRNNKYYVSAFDVPNECTIRKAAIRQMFIDQSQSLSLNYKSPKSAAELTKDILLCHKMGIKTVYYHNTPKDRSAVEVPCDSCS